MKFPGDFEFTEVPFTFREETDSSPHALIDVQVGTGKILLAIDTGNAAASIMIAPDVLRRLNALDTGKTRENYDAFGNKYTSKEYALTDVRIGDLV